MLQMAVVLMPPGIRANIIWGKSLNDIGIGCPCNVAIKIKDKKKTNDIWEIRENDRERLVITKTNRNASLLG